MSDKEKNIREKIEKTGMTSIKESFVLYRAFPSFTKKVVKKMIDEGYNISIIDDYIDLTFCWLDCTNNVIFPQKRVVN
jgi:hypothetical protein